MVTDGLDNGHPDHQGQIFSNPPNEVNLGTEPVRTKHEDSQYGSTENNLVTSLDKILPDKKQFQY